LQPLAKMKKPSESSAEMWTNSRWTHREWDVARRTIHRGHAAAANRKDENVLRIPRGDVDEQLLDTP